MKTMFGDVSPLRMIGRCALTGVLIALLATQSFAQGASMGMNQTTTEQNANLAAQPATPAPAAADAAKPAPAEMAVFDLSALPEAPGLAPVPAAVADDAAAANQNALTSAPKSSPHKIHPGWLVLAGAGSVLAIYGGIITSEVNRNKGLAAGVFLAPGAALAATGFYLTFRK